MIDDMDFEWLILGELTRNPSGWGKHQEIAFRPNVHLVVVSETGYNIA